MNFLEKVGLAVLAVLMIPLVILLGAIVLLPIAGIFVLCWNFINNAFTVLPSIGYWQGYAMMIIVLIVGSAFGGTSSSKKS